MKISVNVRSIKYTFSKKEKPCEIIGVISPVDAWLDVQRNPLLVAHRACRLCTVRSGVCWPPFFDDALTRLGFIEFPFLL